MTLLRNSSQYILNTFFYDCEALTRFLSILFLISERLKFSFRSRISDVDCRGHILPRYRYRTNEASFSTSLLRNSGQYILNTIFITVKYLPVFYRSCFNTVILEIFLSLEHFCCLLSTPRFAKLSGSRQRYSVNERIFL